MINKSSASWPGLITFLLLCLAMVEPSIAVKKYLFRTCDQNPFCKRNRHFADKIQDQGPDWKSPYSVDFNTIKVDQSNGVIVGNIIKSIGVDSSASAVLPFQLSVLESVGIRLTIDEKKRQNGEIVVFGHSSVKKQRYNVEDWAFSSRLETSNDFRVSKTSEQLILEYGQNEANRLEMDFNPFKVTFYRNGEAQIVLNDRGLLNYEHWRPLEEGSSSESSEPSDSESSESSESTTSVDPHLSPYELSEGLWDDSFDNHKDQKSRGPESIALDISFLGYKHVYGIPEHADKLSLRETRGGEGNHEEPYRLFNVDIFEYETDSPMAMYGSIPFMQSTKRGGSAGVFWGSAADTYVDIIKKNPGQKGSQGQTILSSDHTSTQTHWMSETGLLDVVVILGDTPSEISRSYGHLTGFPALPQTFSIGYHQCRWNYNSQQDVLDVHQNFDKYNIPYDVIWLDIEYTEDKKYFTWNSKTFPDPVKMLETLDSTKRKLVTIIDPHIKVSPDYAVSKAIESKGLAVKNSEGNVFHGHCWPGESAWIDTFNPEARKFWTKQFALDGSFAKGATNLHIWNDMNEASVFSGPETTTPKDAIHYEGWEERDVHNIYGLTFHNATYDALKCRYKQRQRPFVLTRAYFAGSQRSAAMWTGDNMAKWEYLKIATPMILTSGISGMPFSGADVGGFFGNPSAELLTRWYQAGAFYPFFRGHAHIDSKRREPWLFGEPYTNIIRDAINLRYSLLPSFYTSFFESSINGEPVMKPMYYITPDNDKTYDIDDQFFVGDTGILVKPVTDEGGEHVDIYLPDNQVYYDYFDYTEYKGAGNHKISAPLNKVPVLSRGGHIYSRRDRIRRSSELMKHDPYTLVVSLSVEGTAKGHIYIDDGQSFDYEEGSFIYRELSFENGILASTSAIDSTPGKDISSLYVEKIIIVGSDFKGKEAKVIQQDSWTSKVESSGNSLIIKNPKVILANDWEVHLTE